MKKIIVLLAAILLPLNSFAQFIYLARQDGQVVYLDITELASAPAVGEVFQFIEKEEPLKNVKGEDLGTVYTYGAEVTIKEVQPKFAVGRLKGEYEANPGQKAVLLTPAPAKPLPAAVAEPVKTSALFRSAPLNETLISARMFNKNFLAALNDKNEVKIYSLDRNTFKEKTSYKIPSAKKAFSLSAADAKKTGKEQLFIVVQDNKSEEISTLVLEEEAGKLAQTATLRYAVKDASTPAGKKLYAQEIYKHNGLKTGPVRALEYDGKFKTAKTKLPGPSDKSVFAFLSLDIDKDGGADSVFTAHNGSLLFYPADGKKIDFGSDISFAAAPERIVINNSIYRILPPLASAERNGSAEIAAIENLPKIALLSDSFASYKGSNLRLFKYNGMNFEETKVINLPAVARDVAYAEINGQSGYLIPLAYENGKTILELY